MDKALRLICDFITVVLLVACVGCVVAFATIGHPSYYNGYYNQDEVTQQLEDKISDGNGQIAEETGIEIGAFDYALSEKIDLDRVKLTITSSIFNGVNTDYSQTENIDEAYREGILEYYRRNGLECDNAVVEKAVTLACENFNKVMGADNMNELSNSVLIVSKHTKAVSIITLALMVFFVSRMFALNLGRTKTFAHIGSVLISGGCCFITTFVMNSIIDFPRRLHITSNEIIMGAISYGTEKYLKLLATVGVILIICGIVAVRFVYNYYVNKHAYQLQEKIINEKIRDDAQKVLTSIENTENGDFGNGNE